MSSTTAAAPLNAERSLSLPIRVGLVALAIVVLLGASFALGRATASTGRRAPAIEPTVSHPYPDGQDTDDTVVGCFVGRPC